MLRKYLACYVLNVSLTILPFLPFIIDQSVELECKNNKPQIKFPNKLFLDIQENFS
jgi:hypothetical protein